MEENRRTFSADYLYMVTNELDNHAVAIRGSDVFTVTYSLAAKVIVKEYLLKCTLIIRLKLNL